MNFADLAGIQLIKLRILPKNTEYAAADLSVQKICLENGEQHKEIVLNNYSSIENAYEFFADRQELEGFNTISYDLADKFDKILDYEFSIIFREKTSLNKKEYSLFCMGGGICKLSFPVVSTDPLEYNSYLVNYEFFDCEGSKIDLSSWQISVNQISQSAKIGFYNYIHVNKNTNTFEKTLLIPENCCYVKFRFMKWSGKIEGFFADDIKFRFVRKDALSVSKYIFDACGALDCVGTLFSRSDKYRPIAIASSLQGKNLDEKYFIRLLEADSGYEFYNLKKGTRCFEIEILDIKASKNNNIEPALPFFKFNNNNLPEVDNQKYVFECGDIGALCVNFESIISRAYERIENYWRAALCSINFLDSSGNSLHSEQLRQSDKYGNFFYLYPGFEGKRIQKLIALPEGCSRMEIEFRKAYPPLPVRFKSLPQFSFYSKDNFVSALISGLSYPVDGNHNNYVIRLDFEFSDNSIKNLQLGLEYCLFREDEQLKQEECVLDLQTGQVCQFLLIDGALDADRLELKLVDLKASSCPIYINAVQLLYAMEVDNYALGMKIPEGGEFGIKLSTLAFKKRQWIRDEKSALCVYSFKGDDGETRLPASTANVSPELGSYFYLPDAILPEDSEIIIQSAEPCAALELLFRQWHEGIQTFFISATDEFVKVEQLAQGSSLFSAIFSEMDKIAEEIGNEELIVIYSGNSPKMQHALTPLRINYMAIEFAREGFRVVYFPAPENIMQSEIHPQPNIWQFPKTMLPLFLQKICISGKSAGTRQFLICSGAYDQLALTANDLCSLFNWHCLLESRDDMEGLHNVGYAKWFTPALEIYAARKFRRISTVSERLKERFQLLSDDKGKVKIISNGLDAKYFEDTRKIRKKRLERNFGQQKIIFGYVGHLTSLWFDWELIFEAALKFPDFYFEFIGNNAPEFADLPQNLAILGPIERDRCIPVAARWQGALIPFKPLRVTRSIDPLKLYEYLAYGLPVISAPMGGVFTAPLTHVYESKAEFYRLLEKVGEYKLSHGDLLRIEAFLEENFWIHKTTQTIEFMHQ